ncbi:HTH domain-containing protein [Priestia koreensis]|uniref:HTH domain-containing protein n=1 Tax=Priestia koreensis TaxID=284581 RepID=UPI003018EB0A
MTKFLIVSSDQFMKLQEIERSAVNHYQRKKVRNYILDDIAAKLGRRYELAKKAQLVIEEIVWKASDRGYSFNGREKLAEKLGVSLRTVDNAIKLLKESGEVVVAYRENPASNSAKTPVFFFKRHANYPQIKRVCKEVCEEENRQKSTESKVSPLKRAITDLLLKRQELNINKRTHSVSKIIEYITYKIEEQQQKNPGGIIALSSYIDKLLAEELRKVKQQFQQRKESAPRRGEPIVRYNFLDGTTF